MDVCIIGGGIGGLATALYLHREGIACRVYEAVPQFSELGVGLNLGPHAIRALAELGLVEALAKVALEPQWLAFFNHHGQEIHRTLSGRFAGYKWPHFSAHRGDLHGVLLDAVKARLGQEAIALDHRCTRIDQDERGVTVHMQNGAGEPLAPVRAAVALGIDGVNSTVRKQLYPNEGRLAFGGINMWRGASVYAPILDGRTIILCGGLEYAKLVIYPMREHPDGTQLINWNVEVRSKEAGPNAWNKNGRPEDFLWRFEGRDYGWIDFPDLVAKSIMVLEYPMVDRDPVDRWTFGRVTLLGDAAHPMYPRSGNGAAQSILDGRCIARLLKALPPEEALKAYEKERLEPVNRIVLGGRSNPYDTIIETVEKLAQGQRFGTVEDLIPRAELQAMLDRFLKLTGNDVATVNAQG